MSLQELVNKSVEGLARQGFERSARVSQSYDGKVTCQFRGVGGRRCAIGVVLEDKEIAYFRDGQEDSGKTNSNAAIKFNVDVIKIMELQQAHDKGITPEIMKDNLRQFVNNNDLVMPEVLK